MEKSRTKNTIRNVRTGFIVQLINKLMAFVVRTVFIKFLNTEYLGVNGLFTNILTMISFAELGIGTAIIFNMYKPVADDDKEKIKSLMKLYQKSYNTIGCIVFVLGLCVIPFFDLIIKDVPNIKENIYLIYFLFLINTSSSYFFTYKKSIISAYQQESIINKIDSIFYLGKSVFEILFLYLTKNYIVYLVIQISGTILENIIIADKANKIFPFLKENNVEKLPKEESQNIFSNVKSLIIYKFGAAIMDGTDNILISSLVNVATVGLCSNYTLIITSIKGLVLSAMNGVTASIGNLNAVANKERKENIFYQLTLISYFVYSFCAIAFIVLLNPFIEIWLGVDYVLNIWVPIALAVSFFVCGMRTPAYTYRVTLGLFEKGKITPYIGAITNIILSIILCKVFGVAGIFIATSIAQLVSYSWIDPYLIHKYAFESSLKKYFKKLIIYFLAFALNTFICLQLSNMIDLNEIFDFIVSCIIVLFSNVINLIIFYRCEEFKSLEERFITPIFNKIKNKIKRESD